MSLQIWLPLRGDLTNNGLYNSVLNLHGTTSPVSNDNGKIGKCYTFSDGYILGTQNFMNNDTPDWSYCAWIKISAYHNGCLFTCRDAVTSAGFAIFHYDSSTHWLFDDGDRWNFDSSIELPLNTWTHVAFVRKKGSYRKFYVNGILAASTTSTNTPTNVSTTHFTIGESQQSSTYADGNNFQGQINDVRIYNHALSAKEVKEISKGLVCHYPLDNNGIGNPNLVPNQGKYYSESTAYVRTSPSKDGNAWLSGSHFIVEPSTTYTFSVCSDGNLASSHATGGNDPSLKLFTMWLYLCNSDTTKNPDAGGYDNPVCFTSTNYNHQQNGNRHIWQYTTKSTETHMSVRVNNYSNGTDNLTIKYWQIKIEKGSKATPWCPNSNDPEYTSFFSADILLPKDISGYNNNAIMNVDTSIVSDTPRYLTSTVFNGTSSYVAIGQGGKLKDTITINIWAYSADWSAELSKPIISCTEQGGFCLLNEGNYFKFYMGTGTSSNTYQIPMITISEVSAGWHMFTCTYDGFTTKGYIDGVLKCNSSTYSTKTPIYHNQNNGIFIGAEATNSTQYPAADRYFNGKISDVRIYATALSDADIKELYNNAASIDDEGNMYGYDFTEENIGKVSIERDGLVKTEVISEFIVNTFDKTLYAEPDGSAWIRIFHHNNPGTGNLFSSTDAFTSQVYKDQNRWFNISLCNLLSNSWELMVKQKASSNDTEAKYRWIQSYNPMTATYDNVTSDNVTKITTTGYSEFNYCGGLWRKTNDENTYLRQAGTSTGNWHGAMGAWNVSPSSGNRVPGFNSTFLENTGYMDLYLRVDNINLNKTSFAKDFLKTNELHEI